MQPPTYQEIDLLHDNICKAVGDPTRIQILYALHNRPLHVTALADVLDTPQPTVSRHLAILRDRSLVVSERDGATVVYSLADPAIVRLLNEMRQIMHRVIERRTNVITA